MYNVGFLVGAMKTVGYARVSTGEQEEALFQQIARLNKYGVSQVYADVKSGKSSDRKEFNKMLSACNRGEISEIVITRLDRLARSVVTMSKTIKLLEEKNIKLTILDAPIEDISNPFSKFSINQMSALAQFESDLLQNRVKHGMNYFREQVKAPGKTPFGYKRENEKYQPDDAINTQTNKSNWAIASEIIDYIIENKSSLRGTCHWINETYGIRWSTTGFQNWIKNPVLRGHTRYNVRNNQYNPSTWNITRDTHIALISPDRDKELRFVLDENKRKWGINRNFENRGNALLSGQIYCGSCGGKCYVSRKDKDILICAKRNVYGKSFCQNKYGTPLTQVVSSVDMELTKRALELRNFAFNDEQKDTPEIIELKKSLENLEKLPPNEFVLDAITGIKSKISQLQIKIDTPNIQLIDEWVSIFSDINFYRLMPEETKFQLYRRFVDSVVILNRQVIEIKLVSVF